MAGVQTDLAARLIHETDHPFHDTPADLDPIIERIAGRPFALTGEASHGALERDLHIAETLDARVTRQRAQGPAPKIVLRAHNSHLGDARAACMKQAGKLNVGQLVRERYHEPADLPGFTRNGVSNCGR